MTAYTLFFSNDTFERRDASTAVHDKVIDYLAADDKRPINRISEGDEVFVVGISRGRVRLGGRLIAAGAPVDRKTAERALGRTDLLSKDIFVLATVGQVDRLRCDCYLSQVDAASLRMHNADGSATDVSSLQANAPDPNLFRAPHVLESRSAEVLRRVLGLSSVASRPQAHSHQEDEAQNNGSDDDEFRLASIKSRRGQPAFRRALLDAYGYQCVVTRCHVEELLEAAHITPHAEHTDYRVSNGLLLRADIHTLFDLYLLCIDDRHRVRVSPRLRNTEYWKYDGQPIARFPKRIADNPDRDALMKRLDKLVVG